LKVCHCVHHIIHPINVKIEFYRTHSGEWDKVPYFFCGFTSESHELLVISWTYLCLWVRKLRWMDSTWHRGDFYFRVNPPHIYHLRRKFGLDESMSSLLPQVFITSCHGFSSHIQHLHRKFLTCHKCSSQLRRNFVVIATVVRCTCDEVSS
jgi:hypothetical protein